MNLLWEKWRLSVQNLRKVPRGTKLAFSSFFATWKTLKWLLVNALGGIQSPIQRNESGEALTHPDKGPIRLARTYCNNEMIVQV